MYYIEPGEVQRRLIAYGDRTTETVPDLEAIASVVKEAQIHMDKWLSRSLLPKEYEGRFTPSHKGAIALPHSPVLSVISVTLIPINVVGGTQTKPVNIPALWNGGQSVQVYSTEGRYLIKYVAGYEEIPEIVQEQTFAIVRRAIKEGCSFLYEPTKDLQSVQLPGGVGQSFRLGQTQEAIWIDRYMNPLASYKRSLKF